MQLRHRRLSFQLGFFALFLLAPSLDLLRFDLHEAQLWFLGQRWSLGIAALAAHQVTPTQAGLTLVLRGFLPALALIAAFFTVAWRYGRLYCGWLCPHFSLVELINHALYRACGKWSLWEKRAAARQDLRPDARWWPVFGALCAGFGFLWSVTLLTYLLPPAEIWGALWHGTLTPNQARFLVIAGVVFTLEFAFARHLFCRFGCAIGLFQSLAWMANPRGMVVAFERAQARDCRSCSTARYGQGSACDHGCPMRLHPRNIKRMMFSCVQCGQCLTACDESQGAQGRGALLEWRVGEGALRETLRQRREEQAPRPHAVAVRATPEAAPGPHHKDL